MRIIKRKILLPLLFVLEMRLCCSPVLARGPGTSGAVFLKIDMGARAASMGGAFCAVADDVSAIYWNPAGLVQLERKEITAMHNEWIQGIRRESIVYAHPIKELLTLGVGITYLYTSGLIKRDIYGNELGETFGAYGGVTTFSGSKMLCENVSIGVNLKIIQEGIEARKATAFALDIGVLYKLSKLRLGAVIQNLGTKVKFEEKSFALPLDLKAGLAYKALEHLILATDIDLPLDNEINLRVGAEYQLADLLSLRLGFKTSQAKNTGVGISGGLGFRFKDYQLDYGFLPFGDLGNTHRISFSARFGKKK
ncbi:MAG: PorV/PorQ family protein [Candidatus Lokiarchaeia archaeon]